MDALVEKKLILLTNDDGVQADGLQVVARNLRSLGEVFIVAPDRERSAAGHSLTMRQPVRVHSVSERTVAIEGTPTDCVLFAVKRILPRKPDLVVSGINCGANLGDDITYSGTVAAAMEGTLLGIPSFSISLASRDACRYERAAEFAAKLAGLLLEKGLPPDVWLNVNVPAGDKFNGVRVTRQARRIYQDEVVEMKKPDGQVYYHLDGPEPGGRRDGDTDFEAIEDNMISITPLKLDLTSYGHIELLKKWQLEP